MFTLIMLTLLLQPTYNNIQGSDVSVQPSNYNQPTLTVVKAHSGELTFGKVKELHLCQQ